MYYGAIEQPTDSQLLLSFGKCKLAKQISTATHSLPSFLTVCTRSLMQYTRFYKNGQDFLDIQYHDVNKKIFHQVSQGNGPIQTIQYELNRITKKFMQYILILFLFTVFSPGRKGIPEQRRNCLNKPVATVCPRSLVHF